MYGGFQKIRGPDTGVPVIRIIVYWGPFWGPSFLEPPIYQTIGLLKYGGLLTYRHRDVYAKLLDF